MHGAGRVGGDKFDHDLFALPVVAAAVFRAERFNILEHVYIELLAQEKVDEAGSCDFEAVKIGAVQGQVVCDCLRDFAGRCMECTRAYHGGVGGPIAVGPVRGDLNGKFGDIRLRQFAVGAGLFHGRADGIPQFSGRLLHEFRHLYFLPP